jgi:hypothetical protein
VTCISNKHSNILRIAGLALVEYVFTFSSKFVIHTILSRQLFLLIPVCRSFPPHLPIVMSQCHPHLCVGSRSKTSSRHLCPQPVPRRLPQELPTTLPPASSPLPCHGSANRSHGKSNRKDYRSKCHVSTDYHMAMTSLVWDILRYVCLMSL